MKTRVSSIVIGISCLIVFAYLGYAGPRFRVIYADLYSAEAALPLLTQLVLAPSPFGWVGLGVAALVLCVGKDRFASLRKIPNWPFALALVAVGMGAVMALFLPFVITIEEIGSA